MRATKLLGLLLLAILPLMSFKPAPAADGYYAFIIVDGVWKDGTGYASRIIYFPGYNNCKRYRDIDFFAEAKRSFSSHLKAYHSAAFPYGENNNFRIIKTRKHSTYDLLKTREQAAQRLTEWVAAQKGQGYRVVHTSFGYSCSAL